MQPASPTAADLRNLLFAQCEQFGSQRAWARSRGISVSLVSLTLAGKRDMAPAIANALGYVATTIYTKAGA